MQFFTANMVAKQKDFGIVDVSAHVEERFGEVWFVYVAELGRVRLTRSSRLLSGTPREHVRANIESSLSVLIDDAISEFVQGPWTLFAQPFGLATA